MELKTYQSDEIKESLLFSTSKIELELSAGQIYEGSFEVEEQNKLNVEGYIYSSNFRMHINNPEIKGSIAKIDYVFDATGMNAADSLKGSFNIITNKGEYAIGFSVEIQRENIDSSIGSIKNLFHFANLAKSSWEEAISVFYHPEFASILTGNDAKYINLYRGLTQRGNKNHNLEEFLIGINKKQKIEYVMEQDSFHFSNPRENIIQKVKINRNGWGFTYIAIKTNGDYLSCDKDRIVESDFDSNSCTLTFIIDKEKIHEGKNPGTIVLKSLYGEYVIDIDVYKNSFGKRSVTSHKKKSMTYSLTRHYIDFTAKKLNMQKWSMLTSELLTKRADIDENENLSTSLMQLHLLILQEKLNEAQWLLEKKVKSRIEEANNELFCYYLYMLSLLAEEDSYKREIIDQIESIYNNDKTNWRVGWLLIKTSDDIRRSPSKKFGFVLEQLRYGCKSPIMYLEAIKALSERPTLLMHLEDEELRILTFGAREGLLSKDIMNQVSYLIIRARNFDNRLLKLAKYMYAKDEGDDALQAVCVQLMKGGRTSHEDFRFYSKAVEKNFPLTRLYESYMLSMDLRREEPIPKRVLMYFSYQSDLPVAQNAYIYAYVVKNREENPEVFETFQDTISRFLVKQLYAGRVDANLAYLYQKILLEEMFTEDNIKQFAKILFINAVTVEDADIANVVVIDDRLKDEMVYPVNQKVANVALLGSNHTILLEDFKGNRFYATREYETSRFFAPGRILPKMESSAKDSLIFNLFVCEDTPEFLIITEQNEERYSYLEQSTAVSDNYRGSIRLPLARYYLEKDDIIGLDRVLSNFKYDDVSYRDYNELIKCFMIRNNLSKAMDFVIHYGVENIEPKTLVRLGSRLVEEEGYIEDEKLLYILSSAFERGKYDETGLKYLLSFYKGPIKNLRNLWRAAVNFDVDTYDICEKMIIQTLQTGAYIGEEAKVLKYYVDGGAKPEVEELFLSYYAYEAFVHGRVVDEYMFNEMERLYRQEGHISTECMLAWLMYTSKKLSEDKLEDNTADVVRAFIRELYLGKKMVLPFFAEFKDYSIEAAQISNQTIIEYRGNKNCKVVINYMITKEGNEDESFQREEMVDMYGGVYVKSFLLFFGESLQYYITEEVGEIPEYTESGNVNKNDAVSDSTNDRYSMVNDISIANTLKDYSTAFKLLEAYKYKEYLVDNIFTPQ